MNQPNRLTKCFPCSSCDQGRGLFAKQNCTSTSDTVCDVIAGHFCTDLIEDEECRSARRHSDCEPGHRVKEPGTRRTDTTCEPCPAGSFSPEGVNCSLWTNSQVSPEMDQPPIGRFKTSPTPQARFIWSLSIHLQAFLVMFRF
uniref:tumor necrosis factor receptor superfamily member 14-like isoform X3 n=1 Tax=Gasterosteus aculeatus aculeatus TaxID=481459 RepID=UPI001A99AE71|nr:tumor necrosis factor receptor superfamily member 14-like isoform X3 [Gasterosteus aculeatus aculeatus]